MSNGVSLVPSYGIYPEYDAVSKDAEIVVLPDSQPDSFEKKQNKLFSEKTVAAAVVGGGIVGKTFVPIKNHLAKVVNSVEKEVIEYLGTQGKQIKNFSTKLKGNLTFIPAAVASFGLAALVLKDSDKDGKLDILEMASKFINPSVSEE